MIDETKIENPNEENSEVVNTNVEEENSEINENSENTNDSNEEKGESNTSIEDTGVKDATEVEKSVPEEIELHFGTHVELDINGTKYVSKDNPEDHILTIPANIENSVREILFNAHGITPNED